MHKEEAKRGDLVRLWKDLCLYSDYMVHLSPIRRRALGRFIREISPPPFDRFS